MRPGVFGALLCGAAIAGCAQHPYYPRQPQPVQAGQPSRGTQSTEAGAAPETARSPQGPAAPGGNLDHLFADPRLDPIRDKVPLVLRSGAVTPVQLTNDDRPTAAEKRAIKVWLSIREQAQQYQLEHRGPPSPLLVRTRQQVSRAILQLYHGQLTYGQFAQRIQALDSSYQAAARQLHQ
ncbi:MAG TPA: hypothetical protein VMH32_16360 [Burkholderiales bacterium]|nr:hypothetical protein [Burkholderiales bacterium]